ncbi:MAG: sulfofructosephosphate aldolase [Gaiellaceae bacterium]|nr:sulfofructosephosphate aldolase [Gaiellaceae bacterium]
MTLDALARESGTFLMVAMDQRESLRTMLAEHGHDATDERIVRFKLAVTRELSPHASALLVDSEYGWFDRIVSERLAAPSCGLIMAVDALDQQPGEIVEDTSLDETVDIAAAAAAGVVALKLLVIWRDDAERARRVEMSHAFSERARAHGLLSVLEPVVRGPEGFDREASIVEAAQELSVTGCDLYKCQVPLAGKGDPAEITRWAREIDAVTVCPWVVLSQGVDPADFPAAVEAACKGGASGMLAGRAVWTATLGADDPTELLRGVSVPKLEQLGAIVDAHGRPWRAKAVT